MTEQAFEIMRGEIYWVSLDPIVGREAGGGKIRPVAVLSINDINLKPLVVTVIPGTSVKPLKRPNFRNSAIVLPTKANGLDVETVFECHQLRAIDKSRFTSRRVGALAPLDLERIENAARFSLGLLG